MRRALSLIVAGVFGLTGCATGKHYSNTEGMGLTRYEDSNYLMIDVNNDRTPDLIANKNGDSYNVVAISKEYAASNTLPKGFDKSKAVLSLPQDTINNVGKLMNFPGFRDDVNLILDEIND
tara:strand:+ start:520 stop:882 length:363 start_codon:yes stop_codon:yes gene_type:complete